MPVIKEKFLTRKINRRQAIKTAGLAASGAVLASASPLAKKTGAPEKLNFLFILTDDQRWDALSIAGHPFLKTPNLDWIARTGARFTNAFVTTSLCSPSRACFLTGKYAHIHGVTNNITPWREQNTAYLELMKQSGYFTGFIGKWHMPGKGLPDLYGTGRVDRFISFTAVAGQGKYFNCPMFVNGKKEDPRGYISDVLNDYAVQFLKDAQGKNFCPYLAHKAAHAQFATPAPYKGMYKNDKLCLPPEYLDKGLDARYASMHLPMGLLGGNDMEKEERKYFETIKALDDSLARVFEELDRQKILDRTVIIFAGDNGYLWGEHNLIDKRFAFEESIRIPFLVCAPGIIQSPGKNIDAMTLNIDLAPSILDMAGLPLPADMQGASFKPLLSGKNDGWRQSFLYEYFYDAPYPVPGLVAVRTADMKYVRYENNKLPEEMYDLGKDPKEKTNLAPDPGRKIQKQEMVSLLKTLLDKTGYPEKDRAEKFKL